MSTNSDPPTFPGSDELRELVRLAFETGLDNRSKYDSLVPMCLVGTHDRKLELLALVDNSPRSTEDVAREALAGHDALRYAVYYEANVRGPSGKTQTAIIVVAGETQAGHGYRFLQPFRKGLFGGVKPVEAPILIGDTENFLS